MWCAKDRANAFTAAMSGQDPGKGTCPNPVAELTQLAQSLGIGGTPTLLAPDQIARLAEAPRTAAPTLNFE